MITVLGAGSIGCYVGGTLLAAGHPVTLIGRKALTQDVSDGLRVTDLDGATRVATPRVTDDPGVLARAETILLCVKSADTAAAAQLIKDHAQQSALIVSLQNGVTNSDTIKGIAIGNVVASGMVGFNVVRDGPDHFVQTTEGEVILDPLAQVLADALDNAGLEAKTHSNMGGVQWAKLLMNLNNALNALSGIGLKAQLEDRDWRRVLAACVREGLAVAKADGIRLEQLGKIHPSRIPLLLSLPNFVFLRIAQAMLRVDPQARSSMADDYRLGRPPEVDWLNGHIVQRGQELGIPCPVNARVTTEIHSVFKASDRKPLTSDPKDLIRPS